MLSTSSGPRARQAFSGVALAALCLTLGANASAQVVTTALRDDIIVKVAPGGLGAFVINDFAVNTTVEDGTLAMQADDPRCVPSAATPCGYTIKSLRLFLGDFQFQGAPIEDGTLVNQAPIRVSDDGTGLIVPTGTPFFGAFTIDGERRTATQTSPGGLSIFIDLPAQQASLLGGFAGSLEGYEINATVFASAHAPFKNLPPVASARLVAGPDCAGAVQLDATESLDETGGPLLYRWLEGETPIAVGAVAAVALAAGAHEIRLEVFDTFGARGSDQVRVEVPTLGCADKVRPTLACVLRTSFKRRIALFGFVNEAPAPVEIPVGAQNQVLPPPANRGQPVRFEPGAAETVLRIPFRRGESVTWQLGAAAVTASDESPLCPCPSGSSRDPHGVCRCRAGQILGDDGVCRCPWPGQVLNPRGCSCPSGQHLVPDWSCPALPDHDALPAGFPPEAGRPPFGLRCGGRSEHPAERKWTWEL